ncbi:hypothetical protein [Gorillibacterium sp. CAU 1737]|uniref:hypothetical protein n=1 Tax=Gorillibacterium sp. CAU 1737 TaxID=3140362 RepID=UPI0032607000
MTALITIICLTLGVAIAATSFVYGRQVGYTKRDAEQVREQHDTVQKQLAEAVNYIDQLEHQAKVESREKAPEPAKSGWEMFDGRRG